MPSNGGIANVILHKLDLLFQGQIFTNVNVSKMMRASTKVYDTRYIFIFVIK